MPQPSPLRVESGCPEFNERLHPFDLGDGALVTEDLVKR